MSLKCHFAGAMLLRVNLPNIDQFSVARRLGGEHILVTAVVLAGFLDECCKLKGFDASVDDVMNHSFRFAELAARIRVALRQTSISEDLARTENAAVSHEDFACCRAKASPGFKSIPFRMETRRASAKRKQVPCSTVPVTPRGFERKNIPYSMDGNMRSHVEARPRTLIA
jgi:DNA-binding response OmpR family regulator